MFSNSNFVNSVEDDADSNFVNSVSAVANVQILLAKSNVQIEILHLDDFGAADKDNYFEAAHKIEILRIRYGHYLRIRYG